MLKRIFALILSLSLLTACGTQGPAKNTTTVTNPFRNCETLQEAEDVVGFSLEIPEELAACEKMIYRAANSDALTLLEVIFEQNGNEIRLRKSPGTEDNSGVYEEFEYSAENEQGIVMKGSGEGYQLVIWQDGEYSYSISCGEGVDFDTLYDWVCSTK